MRGLAWSFIVAISFFYFGTPYLLSLCLLGPSLSSLLFLPCWVTQPVSSLQNFSSPRLSFLLFSSFARRARSSVYSHWPQIVPARPHQCVRVPRKRAWLVEFPSVDDRAVAPTAATFATRVVVVPQYGSLAPPAASDPFSALDSHADSLIQRAEGCRRALAQARPRAPSLSSLLCLWAASQKPVFSLFRCPALARSLLFSSFRAARREKPSRRPPLRLEAQLEI